MSDGAIQENLAGLIAGGEQREPQTRAAVLDTSRVFDAEALTRALTRLADSGWNSVVLPGFIDGYPIFPSPVWAEYGMKPQHPEFRKWNPLEVIFDIAWRKNLDIVMSIRPYMVDWVGHRKSPMLRRYPKWAAARHPNRKLRQGQPRSAQVYYCPVNPDLRRFLGQTFCALLEAYPFHGLLFDLRHYPFYSGGGSNYMMYCYCDACRKASLRDLGFDPASVDFAKEKNLVQRWRDWQSEQMDQAMGYIRLRALKARCTMRILGLLTTDSGLPAGSPKPLIHWRRWVERSLVEALVLDGYSPETVRFEQQLQGDLDTLQENSLLLPMMPRKAKDGEEFLRIFERHPIPGFMTRFDDWDLPDFDPTERAVFSEPAFSVESDPIYSISALFGRMSRAAFFQEQFVAFLQDLERILTSRDLPLTVERLTMVAENIRGLHDRVKEGVLDFGARREQMLHDLDLCARLAYLAVCDLVG